MIYSLITLAVLAAFGYITYQSVAQSNKQKDNEVKVPTSSTPVEPTPTVEPEVKRVYQKEKPNQVVDEQPEEEIKKPDYTLKNNN